VRIPLDYYRILGLPIQATAEQLRQAHRDRTLQLPRREYSEAAIAARRQLLDEAHAILSNSDKRHTYDAGFLAKSYDLNLEKPTEVEDEGQIRPIASEPAADSYTPSIEIQDNQLVGALLILLELGEYELVLKLGRPYLSSGSLTLNSGRFGQPDIVFSDIVLTVAFACLELGREQWQQGQYENAAESLETGQELLLREGLFASVRGEMQADLFKLRPYRILELLALPEGNEAERRQGLRLLQDMLQDRGGIDGSGDDQSGLSVDDFLRFIQQLRGYLTSAEQQALFEAEARRPSAVATYLAVYALLARGFAYQQPALIRRAKLMLIRLGTRQDVHLEQAVCALLLGQTEEASRALELSQEYESLAFIREHSQGSPDLLPGLCLYSERWLQNEVFPHFRDLAQQQAALKEYFANEQVQAYLEELPNEPEPANQWSVVQGSPLSNGQSHHRDVVDLRESRPRSVGQVGSKASAYGAASATATLDEAPAYSNGSGAMPTAERVSQLSPEGRLNGTAAGRSPNSPDRRRPASGSNFPLPQVNAIPSRGLGKGRPSPRLDRLLFVVALGVLGIGLLIVGINRVTRPEPSSTAGEAAAPNGSAVVPLQPSLAALIKAKAEPLLAPPANAPLTNQSAQQVIQNWLKIKSTAMGQTHDVSQLSQILVEPLLSDWQTQAEELKTANSYFEYQHNLKIESVNTSPTNPDQAQVQAEVVETATAYQDSQVNVSASRDEILNVQYDLIRQDGQWRIQAVDATVRQRDSSEADASGVDQSVDAGQSVEGSQSPDVNSPGAAQPQDTSLPGSVPQSVEANPSSSDPTQP
jgi:ARC6-like, IMS domain/DnaJ domain